MNDTAKVIINLGAPENPTPESAEKFLLEFLSDWRILSLPQPFRYFLAKIISKKRKTAYAAALVNTFQDGVHPIKKYTQSLAEKVSQQGSRNVYVAYRYGENSIAQVVKQLKQNGARRFLFLPLYPHYSRATTRSAEFAIRKVLKKREYKIARPYFDNHDYISALASTIPTKCQTLVVSFHSIPMKYVNRYPYKQQCETTAQLLGKLLGINDIHIGWQSKMGKDQWLEPETCDVLKKLAKAGRKSVAVIAPSFSCDCSETLNELGKDAKKAFLDAGGENFYLCRCLNDSPAHVKMVAKIFKNLETTL